jgi:hypothetical protein
MTFGSVAAAFPAAVAAYSEALATLGELPVRSFLSGVLLISPRPGGSGS